MMGPQTAGDPVNTQAPTAKKMQPCGPVTSRPGPQSPRSLCPTAHRVREIRLQTQLKEPEGDNRHDADDRGESDGQPHSGLGQGVLGIAWGRKQPVAKGSQADQGRPISPVSIPESSLLPRCLTPWNLGLISFPGCPCRHSLVNPDSSYNAGLHVQTSPGEAAQLQPPSPQAQVTI